VSLDVVPKMINFFENCGIEWGDIAFYGSSGKGLLTDNETMKKFDLPENFFNSLKDKYQESVEKVFNTKVKANTSHAQKWDVGGFAAPHSDNSDHEGKPNAFEINKYVGILYLNNDYEGGELYFCDKNNNMEPYLSFKPNAYSYYVFPGGVENIHGVTEITKGTRYTMVSFWDYANVEYSQETLDRWKSEEKEVRKQQAKQKEDWAKGIK
jgi:predicted 2-oxoglutarate/Fe(II)-dependent dioxygenase YbiX